MQSAFPLVVFGAIALFVVVGVLSMLSRGGNAYDQIGQGGFSIEESQSPASDGWGTWDSESDSPAAQAEREQEIRQMLQARNERLVRKGDDPLDIDAEFARLLEPEPEQPRTQHDPGLTAEVRQLVMARNERRVRRGEEPLDVETEVTRTLDELDR